MILEFLFLNTEYKKELSDFIFNTEKLESKLKRFGNIKGFIHDMPDSDNWIIKFELKSNDSDSAFLLSRIYDNIIEKYKPIVLTNESSEYFNRTLYPLANKFERYLRKFLYLKWNSYQGEKLPKVIESLESKDFGEIFNILFIDDSFCDEVKKLVNSKEKGKSGVYTKEDILNQISGLSENTIWNAIIGNETLKYVRTNFPSIRDYRNDIMHAHNFGYEHYLNAKKVFDKAITELENEITATQQTPTPYLKSQKSISTLFDKLEEMDLLNKRIEELEEFQNKLKKTEAECEKIQRIIDKWGETPLSEL